MLKRHRITRILIIILTIAICGNLTISAFAAFTPPSEGDRDYSPSTVGLFDRGYWNLILAPGADESQMNFSWHSDREVGTVGIGYQKRGIDDSYRFVEGTTRDNISTDAGDEESRSTRLYQVNNVT